VRIVVEVALPVFGLVAAGYLAGWRKLLGGGATEALNSLVYWFALPAALFLSMARQPIGDILNARFAGAFMGAVFLTYAAGWAIGLMTRPRGLAIQAMRGVTASFANSGYLGIPFFITAFGPERILPAALATMMMSIVLLGATVILVESSLRGGDSLGGTVRDVALALVTNPLLLASFAGIAWAACQLPLPALALNTLQITSAASGPCALFATGLFLATQQLRADWLEVGWLVGLKLVAHPLIAWALVKLFFPMEPFWEMATVLLAAMPAAALCTVLAQRYRIYVDESAQAVFVSTILSLATLSVVLAFYG
jgi:predicted permease